MKDAYNYCKFKIMSTIHQSIDCNNELARTQALKLIIFSNLE